MKGDETELLNRWKIQDALETYGCRPLGQGLLLDQQRPGTSPSTRTRSPTRPSTSRSSSTSCRRAASSCRSSSGSPTSSATASARCTTPSTPPSRSSPTTARLLRLPDQGQPAAPGRRGDPRLRQAVQLRPRSRLQAGTARRPRPGQRRHADHLQRLQGRRVHPDDRTRRKIGKPVIPVVEKFTELEAIVRYAEATQGPSGHWRPRQAGRARLGTMALVGRVSFQVRPHAHRGARRPGVPQEAQHGRLPAARPLPPRSQITNIRSIKAP